VEIEVETHFWFHFGGFEALALRRWLGWQIRI
jgi:hypothetical protein